MTKKRRRQGRRGLTPAEWAQKARFIGADILEFLEGVRHRNPPAFAAEYEAAQALAQADISKVWVLYGAYRSPDLGAEMRAGTSFDAWDVEQLILAGGEHG